MKKCFFIFNILLLFVFSSCLSTQVSNSNSFVTSAKNRLGKKFVKFEELNNCNSKEDVELLKIYTVTDVALKKETDVLYKIEYSLSTDSSNIETFVEIYDYENDRLKLSWDSKSFTSIYAEYGTTIDYRTENKKLLRGTSNYTTVEIDLDSAKFFVQNSLNKEVILKYKIQTKINAENNDASIFTSVGNNISGTLLYKNIYSFSLNNSKCNGFYEGSSKNINVIEGSITFYGDAVDYIYSAIQDLNSGSLINVNLNDIIKGNIIIGGEKIKVASEIIENKIKYYVFPSEK
ncbi:MAG: hypothetical protein IK024_09420 [Treponema sp.]|nr:hypothetical protein [Treponema sp.]